MDSIHHVVTITKRLGTPASIAFSNVNNINFCVVSSFSSAVADRRVVFDVVVVVESVENVVLKLLLQE
jgi:hypothetical protein